MDGEGLQIVFTLLAACFFGTVSAGYRCDYSCGVYRYCCGLNLCCRYGFYSMWYFWFIMVLVIISCIVSCGFFRRRQRMMAMQQRGVVVVAAGQAIQQPIPHGVMPPTYTQALAAPPQYPYVQGYHQKEASGYAPAAQPPPYTQPYTFSS